MSMIRGIPRAGSLPLRSGALVDTGRLEKVLRATGPARLFGLRRWVSVSLALYVAFWLELDNPFWAGTSAAIVCQPHLGASLRKGWFRMIGTLVGAIAIVVLTACFPQDRALFLGGLALWGGASALMATLLRNFASYAAALAGYTAAIVAGDLLGATGGVNADAAFLLAVTRASEICIGIVCAGVVLAGTDLGGARRRLAALFASLSSQIMTGFTGTVAAAGADLPDTQVGSTRIRPARHRARPGYRRGDRGIGAAALSFARITACCGRLVQRLDRLAGGGKSPRPAA
jgi:uncharacterized membrane protein YccC